MRNIILASSSPRRKQLLEQVGLEFRVVTSDADEHSDKKSPEEYVMELSSIKAKAVKEKLIEENSYDNTVVIGSDTIVYHNGRVLLKPKDEDDAFSIISSFAGDKHQVYTGVTFCIDDEVISFYEKTDVFVYEMSQDEIISYIKTGEPMDKAGAYGIQGYFAEYIKGICGDYNNVVGLPVARLMHELKPYLER